MFGVEVWDTPFSVENLIVLSRVMNIFVGMVGWGIRFSQVYEPTRSNLIGLKWDCRELEKYRCTTGRIFFVIHKKGDDSREVLKRDYRKVNAKNQLRDCIIVNTTTFLPYSRSLICCR